MAGGQGVTAESGQAEIGLTAVELLASRLCHDLVGPVGAIGNGLELLAEETSRFSDETVAMVTQSAERTAALVALFRAAFGAAGSKAGFGLGEAQAVMIDLLAGSKTTLDWPEETQPGPVGAAKLVLNLLLVANEALPRGGVIAVRTDLSNGFGVTVSARGVGARLTSEVQAALDPSVAPGTLSTRSIHAYFAAHLCRRQQANLKVEAGQDQVRLSAREPPQPGE